MADFTDLDAVCGSDDGFKRKFTFFDLSWKMLEPTNYETDYTYIFCLLSKCI